ncbi:MAG TPA: hypothetical protein VNQ73_21460 [Ilumatobacter sp.]|nr:hypothetical protein [Ilumatobacter sp.]
MLTRLTLLYVGLALFGFGIGLLVLADLGVPPWDVFHTGLADQLGWSLGPTIVAVSFVVLLAWVPLRERPGLGTVSNAVLVGTFIDVSARVLPDATPSSMAVRIALVAAGIVLNGIATGMYIGARFGPGPRDGLMTGIARRRWTVRSVRTAIEASVLAAGIALGGSVGFATVAFALTIGPIAHRSIPLFARLAAPESASKPNWIPAAGE